MRKFSIIFLFLFFTIIFISPAKADYCNVLNDISIAKLIKAADQSPNDFHIAFQKCSFSQKEEPIYSENKNIDMLMLFIIFSDPWTQKFEGTDYQTANLISVICEKEEAFFAVQKIIQNRENIFKLFQWRREKKEQGIEIVFLLSFGNRKIVNGVPMYMAPGLLPTGFYRSRWSPDDIIISVIRPDDNFDPIELIKEATKRCNKDLPLAPY